MPYLFKMWMWIYDYIHQLFNTGLRYLKLLEDRQVGWLTLDRKTGKFKREQQPLWKKFKLLLLFNPVTEWIDRTHVLRLWTHKKNLKACECTRFSPDSMEASPSFLCGGGNY